MLFWLFYWSWLCRRLLDLKLYKSWSGFLRWNAHNRQWEQTVRKHHLHHQKYLHSCDCEIVKWNVCHLAILFMHLEDHIYIYSLEPFLMSLGLPLKKKINISKPSMLYPVKGDAGDWVHLQTYCSMALNSTQWSFKVNTKMKIQSLHTHLQCKRKPQWNVISPWSWTLTATMWDPCSASAVNRFQIDVLPLLCLS